MKKKERITQLERLVSDLYARVAELDNLEFRVNSFNLDVMEAIADFFEYLVESGVGDDLILKIYQRFQHIDVMLNAFDRIIALHAPLELREKIRICNKV